MRFVVYNCIVSCRGYWPLDKRTRPSLDPDKHSADYDAALGVYKYSFAMAIGTWQALQGFNVDMHPSAEDSDLCLRARFNHNMSVKVVGDSVGTLLLEVIPGSRYVDAQTADLINPLALTDSELRSLRLFTDVWMQPLRHYRESKFITKANMTWIIHCGGSQGYEAATILQSLHK